MSIFEEKREPHAHKLLKEMVGNVRMISAYVGALEEDIEILEDKIETLEKKLKKLLEVK